MPRPDRRPPRLIDLHVNWSWQYAGETTLFDPSRYLDVAPRLGQVQGYMGATWAAVLSCNRSAEDWASHPDPPSALDALIVRTEAEFPGRLLIGPDDVSRWRDDAGGLTWGVLGVGGFDALIRSPADLDILPRLFGRGVRVFQPLDGEGNLLGGSSAPGDDRGLTDLGLGFLEALLRLGPEADGPRPALDLAHMNPKTAADVLSWFESDPARANRVIPIASHVALRHEGFDHPPAITPEGLARLRSLGGSIGFGIAPPFACDPEQVASGIEAAMRMPYLGRPGVEGIGVGTVFLGVDRTLPGLGTAPEVVAWLSGRFDRETAHALIQGNGVRLFERLAGASGPRHPSG